ncbi:PREDICTED: tetraspanin-8-like [Chrysochloris asiatica]|uniref:Tetraspanin n=1 Tax=Chrysochloris asiatica TaxID=185453 RepID=A0A9B0WLY6_CHRAS|nr:PREDICTED: tetraspanin-8-like [Chrysochloris asiatica]
MKLCGTAILAVAIWVRVNQDDHELISHGNINSQIPTNLLIAVGSIIMMLGFLGCCGAIRESRCLLILFFIGLLLILILQVAAGVVAAVLKPKLERALNETLHDEVKLLKETNDSAVKFQNTIAKLEEELKCCGLIDGAADWGDNFKKYSDSCTCSDIPNSSCITYEGVYVYKQTCISSIQHIFQKSIIVIIGIAFGLAVIEVLGMVFSMVLVCQIAEK